MSAVTLGAVLQTTMCSAPCMRLPTEVTPVCADSMRSQGGNGNVETQQCDSEKSTLGKITDRLVKILRNRRSSTVSNEESPSLSQTLPELVELNFKENLSEGHLSRACQQLHTLEEKLFSPDEQVQPGDRENLEKDYEDLLLHLWLVLETSLSSEPEHLKALEEAASVLQLEERKDKRWQGVPQGQEIPVWRPRECRQRHDSLMQEVVRKRMEDTDSLSGGEDLSSSVQKDVMKMGKRLKDDLLKVVRNVRGCYPEEFDICNQYAQVYHKVFSAQLKTITEFELDMTDYVYILCWVYDYYPNDVLKDDELKQYIETDALGNLLPPEVLGPLEHQFISFREMKLKEWSGAALKKEEENWQNGILPDITEGCYSSHLAIDILQLFTMVAKEVKRVLGDPCKVQAVMVQLHSFLLNYKTFLGEVMKKKLDKSKPVVKAHLACLEQFRDYLVKNSDVLPEQRQASCLDIVKEAKESAIKHLIYFAHRDVKPTYRKLATNTWLSGNDPGLLDGIEEHTEELRRNLSKECSEELISRMHMEVVVEYVRRLMKKKLKLKDRVQQERAAALVLQDNERLHALFTEAGSTQEWLKNVLIKIAEVLKTQDPNFVELEMATLAQAYRGLSSSHITALLSLKQNLSSEDISTIKTAVKEHVKAFPTEGSTDFFSMVQLKRLKL